MRRVWLALCLVVVGSIVASCGDQTDAGFPPNITNLQFSPTTGTAGGTITVTGSLSFTDREGDVASFAGVVSGPGGEAHVGPTALSASGQTEGTVQFVLGIAATVAGTYAFQVWLVDSPGNLSNTLAGDIQVN